MKARSGTSVRRACLTAGPECRSGDRHPVPSIHHRSARRACAAERPSPPSPVVEPASRRSRIAPGDPAPAYHPAASLQCPGCHWLSEPRRRSHRQESHWRAEPVRSGGTFGRVTRQPLSFTLALAPLAVGFLTAAKRAWLAQPLAPYEAGRGRETLRSKARRGQETSPEQDQETCRARVGRPAPSKIRSKEIGDEGLQRDGMGR